MPGASLLGNKANVGIDEQGAVIAARLQGQHAEVWKFQLTRASRENVALRAVATDQQANPSVAQERRGLQQHFQSLFDAQISRIDGEEFFRSEERRVGKEWRSGWSQ